MYRGVQETVDCTHLVAVQPPVLQLLLEERPADISGVVELAGPVVVQDLAEHNRVSAIVVYISSETQGTKDATVEIQMIQNLEQPLLEMLSHRRSTEETSC